MDTSTRGPLSRPGAMYVRGAVVAGPSELSLHRNAISERLPSCPSSAARPKLSLRRVVFSPNKPPGPCAPEQKVSTPRFPSSRAGWPGRPEMSVAFSLAMQPRGNSIRYFCPSAARRPDLDAAAGCQPRRADADAGRGGGRLRACTARGPRIGKIDSSSLMYLARLHILVGRAGRPRLAWPGPGPSLTGKPSDYRANPLFSRERAAELAYPAPLPTDSLHTTRRTMSPLLTICPSSLHVHRMPIGHPSCSSFREGQVQTLPGCLSSACSI